MYENILQPSAGGRSHSQTSYGGYSSLDELYPRKTSAVVQPMPVHPVLNTPEKENQPLKPMNLSPVLPGTSTLTHNITHMLNEKEERRAKIGLPGTATRASRFAPYSTSHFLSFRHKTLQEEVIKIEGDDSIVDVGNSSHEHLRTSDVPNNTDSSISTQGSSSPQSSASSSTSGSAGSSPSSEAESAISPTDSDKGNKKKARTAYSNEQIQILLKIFHENPYPDSEMMENIGKDLGVPENKIKIWFQNKRARWRRRVNDNMNNYAQPFMPMFSPVPQYGFVPGVHMMSSSPQHVGNYFGYPWVQQPGSVSPNNNNHQQQLPVNPAQSRLQPGMQPAASPMHSQPYSPITMTTPSVSTLSSAAPYTTMTPPQQMASTQHGRQLQYPQFRHQSSYGGTSGY